MKPTPHGGRVELERAEVTETGARYAVTLRTSEGEWRAVATLGARVEVGAYVPADPPEWLAHDASSFLRTLVAQRARAPEAPWPRRLHRWRSP